MIELKRLVYSLLIILLFCISCSKPEHQYENRVFTTFFRELKDTSIEKFYESYYQNKPNEYKEAYLQVLKELKKCNSEFTIIKYDHYKGEKPNLDGATNGVYILENENLKDRIFVKVENNKVMYLLPIGKGKEDIIGWL